MKTTEEFLVDFLINLSKTVCETYLFSHDGSDLMQKKDKQNHFKWCLNQTISFFQEGKCYIVPEPIFEESMWSIIKVYYYDSENKNLGKIHLSLQKDLFTPEIMNKLDGLRNSLLNSVQSI